MHKSGRLPALDGVRAIAIVGILLFHADVPWMRGGFLGVDVFFVLSGYLITGLLLREFSDTHTICLRTFYYRRALRLLPALGLTLAVVIIGARWWFPDAAAHLRGDTLAASLYYSNWWYMLRGESYFEAVGRPPLLRHLWSLSLEEQFYLVIPITTLLVLKRYGPRAILLINLALAASATAAMAGLAILWRIPEAADGTALYYGTHTHSMGMFTGGALATQWRWWQRAPLPQRPAPETVTWIGAISLILILLCFVLFTENSSVLYRGGFLAVSLLTGATLMAASCPYSTFGRWLGCAPMAWLGTRSYAVYLWHYPIFSVTRPEMDIAASGWRVSVIRLGLTVLAAEASHRLVELPFQRVRLVPPKGGFAGALHAVWRSNGQAAIGVIATVALAAWSAVALYTTPEPADIVPRDVRAVLGDEALRPNAQPVAHQSSAGEQLLGVTEPAVRGRGVVARRATHEGVTALGDSVLLATADIVRSSIDNAVVDAEVGRQAAQIARLVEDREAKKQLAPVVVIQLGTNGYVSEAQLRRILTAAGDRKVILVNTRAPRKWMGPNNDLIERVARDYSNVALVDWARVSAGHPEYLVSDGVHPTRKGQRALVAEILRIGDITPKSPASEVRASDPNGGVSRGYRLPASISRGEMPRVSGKTEYQCLVQALVIEEGVSLSTCDQFRRPVALDAYWHAIARCESGGNWRDGGTWSGGLGIAQTTWAGWGGKEFADSARLATPEQQIIVANRISTQGWTKPDGRYVAPVGFSGWGCLRSVGRPSLVRLDPEVLLRQRFAPRDDRRKVIELQAILDLPRHGRYDDRTRHAHLLALRALKLPETLVP